MIGIDAKLKASVHVSEIGKVLKLSRHFVDLPPFGIIIEIPANISFDDSDLSVGLVSLVSDRKLHSVIL